MKVRLLHPHLNRERGEIVDYPSNVADALIQAHKAVAYVETVPKMVGRPPRNKAVSISERK